MTKKIKICLPGFILEAIFPDAIGLDYLPRKKKKSLKKKIAKEISAIANDDTRKLDLINRLSAPCNLTQP